MREPTGLWQVWRTQLNSTEDRVCIRWLHLAGKPSEFRILRRRTPRDTPAQLRTSIRKISANSVAFRLWLFQRVQDQIFLLFLQQKQWKSSSREHSWRLRHECAAYSRKSLEPFLGSRCRFQKNWRVNVEQGIDNSSIDQDTWSSKILIAFVNPSCSLHSGINSIQIIHPARRSLEKLWMQLLLLTKLQLRIAIELDNAHLRGKAISTWNSEEKLVFSGYCRFALESRVKLTLFRISIEVNKLLIQYTICIWVSASQLYWTTTSRVSFKLCTNDYDERSSLPARVRIRVSIGMSADQFQLNERDSRSLSPLSNAESFSVSISGELSHQDSISKVDPDRADSTGVWSLRSAEFFFYHK